MHLDSCLVLVPGWMTSAEYSGLGVLHFQTGELAGWFSKVFLGFTMILETFDSDSFSCCKMKSLTILPGQLGNIVSSAHMNTVSGSLGLVFKSLPSEPDDSSVLRLTNNDRLQEKNELVRHQTQTQDR